MADEMPNSAVW